MLRGQGTCSFVSPVLQDVKVDACGVRCRLEIGMEKQDWQPVTSWKMVSGHRRCEEEICEKTNGNPYLFGRGICICCIPAVHDRKGLCGQQHGVPAG